MTQRTLDKLIRLSSKLFIPQTRKLFAYPWQRLSTESPATVSCRPQPGDGQAVTDAELWCCGLAREGEVCSR